MPAIMSSFVSPEVSYHPLEGVIQEAEITYGRLIDSTALA
jgi:hypothetical protein